MIKRCLYCTWKIYFVNEYFVDELNLSLQNQEMNMVRAKKIIKAFMDKLVILNMKVMTYSVCYVPSSDDKEIYRELQTVIVNQFSFLHDDIQLIMRIFTAEPLVNFLHTMAIEDVMDHPECVMIEPSEAIGGEDLTQASKQNWVKA